MDFSDLLGNIFENTDDAKIKIVETIQSGEALKHFEKMIALQSGNAAVIHNVGLLPKANQTIDILSETSGYITSMNTKALGHVAALLGAGRVQKTDEIRL